MPDILYEDNHVLVAVKPPNMLSQADDTRDTDILSWLKEDVRVRYNKPGRVYLGLVHRLDRPVGGLMVFARTSKAASRLSAQMREHKLGREYLCIVEGCPTDSFDLTDYLFKNERLNTVTVCGADVKGAQVAVLHGKCIARRGDTALCAITLETGRNHQIRVQMSHRGWPLWGDNRYGRGIPGQQIALWGYKLSFVHPTTKEVLTFMNLPYGGAWGAYQDVLNQLWLDYTTPPQVDVEALDDFGDETDDEEAAEAPENEQPAEAAVPEEREPLEDFEHVYTDIQLFDDDDAGEQSTPPDKGE